MREVNRWLGVERAKSVSTSVREERGTRGTKKNPLGVELNGEDLRSYLYASDMTASIQS